MVKTVLALESFEPSLHPKSDAPENWVSACLVRLGDSVTANGLPTVPKRGSDLECNAFWVEKKVIEEPKSEDTD